MGRHNTSRSSNSMRGLPKGRSTYSFPDEVWRVKRKGKKRGRKPKGWRTRKHGSVAQIGQKFKKKSTVKPIKTKSTSFKVTLPEKRKLKVAPKKELTDTQWEIRRKILDKSKFYEEQGWKLRKDDIVRQVASGKHSNTLVREEYEALQKEGAIKPKVEAPKKPKAKKRKKIKVKPSKPRVKMTHIEKMHLLDQCQQFNIDSHEIDNSLTYSENKKHIREIAQDKGYSSEEIKGAEEFDAERRSAMEQYYGSMKNELEEVGFVVAGPF